MPLPCWVTNGNSQFAIVEKWKQELFHNGLRKQIQDLQS